MRPFILSAAVALAAALAPTRAAAEPINLNTTPDTTVTALSQWAFGPGVGVVGAAAGDLSLISEQFLSLSVANSIRFRQNWDLGIDLEWWAPGSNFGGNMSMSYLFGNAAFRPFVGVGAGIRSLDYEGEPFGKGLGVEGLVQAGLYLDVLDNLQLRVRVPYRVIANSHGDQAAGLDVAMLFSSPLRKTTVRTLRY